MTRTWQIMKQITGKFKVNCNRFPKSINVNEKFIKKIVALQRNSINTLQIQNTSKTFEDFLFPLQKGMDYKASTFEEFEKAFKPVKDNKAVGHYDIDSNVIIKVYDEISYPLFMIFHSSFNEGRAVKI